MKIRIKKFKKSIERNNLNELIIDRTQWGEEISNQIDNFAKEFEEFDDKKGVGEKEEK